MILEFYGFDSIFFSSFFSGINNKMRMLSKLKMIYSDRLQLYPRGVSMWCHYGMLLFQNGFIDFSTINSRDMNFTGIDINVGIGN